MGPVPDGCRLVPDPFFHALSSTDGQEFAPINEAPTMLFGDDLLACEVDVWVEVDEEDGGRGGEASAGGTWAGKRPRFLSL